MNSTAQTDKILDMRGAIEHRATWFYFLIKEAMDSGLSLDFASRAITKCGCFHGETRYPRTDDLTVFADTFLNDNVVGSFEMDVKERSADRLYIEFHHCPLVDAWKKLTDDEDLIARMCDIAMDGDRGIASTYDCFEFELGKTIAKGDSLCEVTFRKK